ncbi:Hypothetical predicted protein [Mytilus galloprovincialis]|nr:Hypothetical predicted protein [Mytilus galloprovincialis]
MVRVYRNRFEHYAVINRDVKFTNTAVFLNLKNCQVKKTKSNGISVISDNIDGNALTFTASHEVEADSWINALRPELLLKRRLSTCSMSSLEEKDKEDIGS